MIFWVYLLYSNSSDKYYIGQTNNLERRLLEHNQGKSNYTKSGKPWKIVFTKRFVDRSSAMAFERELKSKKSRLFIEKTING